MKYTEEATCFSCAGDRLLGILTRPEIPNETGIIVIVGGPQYRVGSHRQFVLLSRTLAAAGYAVLRFDYRGMGDSEGKQRDFQAISPDIAAAIEALCKHVPSVKKVALWGLCDGASAALLYCFETQDPRVSNLCLLNPWVRSEASLARTQLKHYYTQRLMQQEFWLKLLNGKMALSALSSLAQNIRLSASGSGWLTMEKQSFQQSMATAWNSFSGQILLLLSSEDYVAKEFLEYAGADSAWKSSLGQSNLFRRDLDGIDHTFSSAASRKLAENLTLDWLARQPTQLLDQQVLVTHCSPSEEVDKILSVSVFRHPDEFPLDVRQLFEKGEQECVEFGVSWFRNFVNSVYPDHDGVRIYVLRKQGHPVAALPVLAKKNAMSQQVESLSNYYTAIYAPLIEKGLKARDMIPLIRAVTDAHAPLSSLRFSPMNPESASYRTLMGALRASGLVPFRFFCFGNWYLHANENWSNYLKNREGTIRSTIKRMTKKFAAEGGTLELVLGDSNLDRGLAAYERVYASSWKVAEPYPAFIPSLARTCAERSWLRLGVAWLNGEPIAAQLWIVANGKANIYKLAYDEKFKAYAPGTLLTAMLMAHALEKDQVVEVDYLIGDDPYKKSWMSHRRERWGIIAYNPKTVSGVLGLSKEVLGRALMPVVTRIRLLTAEARTPMHRS